MQMRPVMTPSVSRLTPSDVIEFEERFSIKSVVNCGFVDDLFNETVEIQLNYL